MNAQQLLINYLLMYNNKLKFEINIYFNKLWNIKINGKLKLNFKKIKFDRFFLNYLLVKSFKIK